jgi:hypothetical protein
MKLSCSHRDSQMALGGGLLTYGLPCGELGASEPRPSIRMFEEREEDGQMGNANESTHLEYLDVGPCGEDDAVDA